MIRGIRPGIQTFLDSAGDAACYALTIIKIAEREIGGHIDVVSALEDGIERGFIRFNWENHDDGDNFFIDFPDAFLELLTGGPWSVHYGPADYQARPGEYVVLRYERKTTSGTYSHFRLSDWDSLADSQTVKYGQVVSTRVFRRAA